MSWKSYLPFALFVGLIAVFGIGLTLKPQELPSEFINEPVPQFEIANLFEDEPNVTSETLSGEFTLLNVFGSWCRTCIIEHPYLVQLTAVGESSGRMAECLDFVAEAYNAEVPRVVKWALSLIEPCVLIFGGAIVAYLLVAAILPIFKVYETIG